MLVNLYSSKTPIAVFSLPILIGFLAIPVLIIPHEADQHFWNWQTYLDQWVSQSALVEFGLTIFIVSLNTHQINNVYNRHSFFSKATFLPGMIYALMLFSLEQLSFSPELIGHLFMIFGLGQLLRLRRQEGAKTIMFWGALFFGIATIFSAFSVLFVLLPWLGLMIFRPFVWREWILAVLGFTIPIIYYLAILYMVKDGFVFKTAQPSSPEELHLDLFQAASYGILILIILVSLYKYLTILRSEIIRFRKQSMLIFHFLWLAAIVCLSGYDFFDHVYLSALIPLGFIVATPFLHAKRPRLVNWFVIIWLIISVANVYLER